MSLINLYNYLSVDYYLKAYKNKKSSILFNGQEPSVKPVNVIQGEQDRKDDQENQAQVVRGRAGFETVAEVD